MRPQASSGQSVQVGHTHAPLRESGAVVCWGGNGSGQTDAPPGVYRAVAAGASHSCGVRDQGRWFAGERFRGSNGPAPWQVSGSQRRVELRLRAARVGWRGLLGRQGLPPGGGTAGAVSLRGSRILAHVCTAESGPLTAGAPSMRTCREATPPRGTYVSVSAGFLQLRNYGVGRGHVLGGGIGEQRRLCHRERAQSRRWT